MTSLIGIALWALIPGFIANRKGRSFWGYFFLSFLISPLISMIITLCVPNLSGEYLQNRAKKNGTTVFECLKSDIPSYVLEQCEKMIGQEDNLRTFLNSCAEQKLIKTSHIGIIWNEYAHKRKVDTNTYVTNKEMGQTDKICFCRKCGKSLLENSKFCRECGAEIKEN